jgi:uncharacterized protein
VLTLYQAEWCPFSSAVRELLSELEIDFVAKQVEPWPEQRDAMREATGTDQIPALVADGSVHRGTREIFRFLAEKTPSPHATGHRRRYHDHATAREADVPGQLIERFHMPTSETRLVDVDARRYELWRGDRRLAFVNYRPKHDSLVFLHTEVDPELEGQGVGKQLIGLALDDVRRKGLSVIPLCPFVAHFVEKHDAFADLVAPSYARS